MTETFIRFIVGGLFVSAFAVLGDVLKPRVSVAVRRRSFVALATLILTINAGEVILPRRKRAR